MFESRFITLALGLALGGCTLTSNGSASSAEDSGREAGPGDSALPTAADGDGPDGSSSMVPVDGSSLDGGDAESSDAEGGSPSDATPVDGSEPEDAAEAGLDAGDGSLPEAGLDGEATEASTDASSWDARADGSGLDAGVVDAAVPDDADSPPAMCGLYGRYAMRIDAQVEWEAKTLFGFVPIIRAGAGELSVTVLVDFDTVGTAVVGDVLPCDAIVPGFKSSNIGGNENYATYFAPEVWESSTMPRTTANLTLGCSIPGCALGMDPLEVLLGSQTGEPFAPWPEEREDVAYPDDDNDGSPGMSISVRGPDDTSGDYSYIPVEVSGDRTSSIQLGVRVGVTLSGALTECDALAGEAGTFDIDTHVAGCTKTDRRLSPCTEAETQFLDNNLPQWTSQTVAFRGVRVAPDAGCYEARAAFATPD